MDDKNVQSQVIVLRMCVCVVKVWTGFDSARWCGVRDSAHEKLYKLLQDPIPEVTHFKRRL